MTEQTQIPFGQWLKQHRKELDLTQVELGGRIGYSAETIRKIESGKRRPSKRLVRLLAKALSVRSSEVATLIGSARVFNGSIQPPKNGNNRI